MRLNRYIALGTGLSRRQADDAITEGRVKVGNAVASLGVQTAENDIITLDGEPVTLPSELSYLILHKPTGYVTSRAQQGKASTIYALLPEEFHRLKPVGRLDRETSGILLLTDDGELAFELSHPSQNKTKCYEVVLDKSMAEADTEKLRLGIELEDGLSTFDTVDGKGKNWTITLHEGRNRQIRRTFSALGYEVKRLHRKSFGNLTLNELSVGEYKLIAKQELS